MTAAWIALMLSFAAPSRADTNASGDTQVTGQVGVGTQVPYAQMHVQDEATDTYAIRVSSGDGTPFFVVRPNGDAGLGLSTPSAHVDMNGSGDSGDLALQLRVGNSSNTTLSQQIVFASTAGTYGHAIVTQSTAGQTAGNAIDFFLWNSTGTPSAAASLEALSLSSPSLSTGMAHIDPVGTAAVQLEVSNGICTGCGTIIRASEQTPSSRERKTDIAYLGDARRAQALQDVQALKHATFQYKRMNASDKDSRLRTKAGIAPPDVPAGPPVRGLIYEDAPESIRGANQTILLDKRVLNLEMALQAADQQITALEKQIAELERQKTKRK